VTHKPTYDALLAQLDRIIAKFFGTTVPAQIPANFWTTVLGNGYGTPPFKLSIPEDKIQSGKLSLNDFLPLLTENINTYLQTSNQPAETQEEQNTQKRTVLMTQLQAFREAQPGNDAVTALVSNPQLTEHLNWIITTFFASANISPDFWEKVFSDEGFPIP